VPQKDGDHALKRDLWASYLCKECAKSAQNYPKALFIYDIRHSIRNRNLQHKHKRQWLTRWTIQGL